jgi:hypothetical protein
MMFNVRIAISLFIPILNWERMPGVHHCGDSHPFQYGHSRSSSGALSSL